MKYKVITGRRKYELTAPYCHELSFTVDYIHGNDWAALYPRRTLIIEKGYRSDGMTGWPDSPETARAAVVHDTLCQLAKLGHCTRLEADREFKRVLIADGVSRVTAGFMFLCVRATPY